MSCASGVQPAGRSGKDVRRKGEEMNLFDGGYPMRDDHFLPCDEHGLPYGCCAACASERIRREYEELARATGCTVEELDADLTAPDFSDEDWGAPPDPPEPDMTVPDQREKVK